MIEALGHQIITRLFGQCLQTAIGVSLDRETESAQPTEYASAGTYLEMTVIGH